MSDPDHPQPPSYVTHDVIRPDPAESLAIGAELSFQGGLITGSGGRATRTGMKDWHTFNGMLLSMQFHADGEDRVDGSAILVAPGVALCASHVLAKYGEALLRGPVECICVGPTRHGLQMWRLSHVTSVPNSDLSIISLTYASALPPDLTFHQGTISTRLPRLGERLSLYGFRQSSIRWTPESPPKLECRGDVLVCRGEVTQRYPNGRDRVMIPGPTLEVDCPAFGGMSGGPVYDEQGFLVGLVCSSLDDGAAGGPAWVSLLWPALAHPFSGGWPTDTWTYPTTLHALEGICNIRGREAYRIEYDSQMNASWSVDWSEEEAGLGDEQQPGPSG